MSPDSERQTTTKLCISCQGEFAGDITTCPNDGTVLKPLKADELIGTIVADKYEVIETIGGGGMGLVYKGRHRLLNRLVAIKVLHRNHCTTANALKRFHLEAQAASALSMPHIITVYDFGNLPDGQPYMVMDYLQGRPLNELVEGPMPVQRSIPIFIQVCSALGHAHAKGVIHRDVKPSNIVITGIEGQPDFVTIVDFGIAKMLNPTDQESGNLTRTGEVFGSALYMSPEQCRGFKLDPRTDIYSLGCVMYRTLSGHPVFPDGDILQLVYKHVMEMPPSFASMGVDVPPELEAIVFKALAKDPGERFQSMQELGIALESLRVRLGGGFPVGQAIPQAQPAAAAAQIAPAVGNLTAANVLAANNGGFTQPVAAAPPQAVPDRTGSAAVFPMQTGANTTANVGAGTAAFQQTSAQQVPLQPNHQSQSGQIRPADPPQETTVQIVVSKRLIATAAAAFLLLGTGAAVAFVVMTTTHHDESPAPTQTVVQPKAAPPTPAPQTVVTPATPAPAPEQPQEQAAKPAPTHEAVKTPTNTADAHAKENKQHKVAHHKPAGETANHESAPHQTPVHETASHDSTPQVAPQKETTTTKESEVSTVRSSPQSGSNYTSYTSTSYTSSSSSSSSSSSTASPTRRRLSQVKSEAKSALKGLKSFFHKLDE